MERFLLPTPDYPPKRGGVARYLSALVSSFPQNIQPLIWKQFPSYKVMCLDFWSRRKSFDVLLTSHVLPVGPIALLLRLLTGKPYEVMLHGLDFDLARTTPKKRFALFFILYFARRVFANSQSLADEVSSFAHRSCIVMYPCVSDEFVEVADVVDGARSLPFTSRLLTVARLVPRKGHSKVFQAMLQLPNTTYAIVGDGPLRKELINEAEELGLADRVSVLQHISDGKLPEIYASHDIFIMPTTKSATDREGFGIVYLEAGLFGLPVIATNQPGVDEAVINGETGLLIEDTLESLVSAIESLASNPEERKRLGANGRRRVLEHFTRQKTTAMFQNTSIIDLTPSSEVKGKDLAPSETPLVSIIIPTYQHAKTIALCIESVLRQSYWPIEIIVVDDGSTDNTQEVLKQFGKKVRVITQKNSGSNPARNRGLADAVGEFVIFTDADVIMKSKMIEQFVKKLVSHPEASYAYGGFRFGWKTFPGVRFNAKELRKMNFVHTTSLVRRSDFPGFDEKIKRFQDWDVWLTMLEKGRVGVLVPGVWFSVMISGESRIGSSWLPSFVYRLPWTAMKWKPKRVKKYEDARAIMVKKHQL